MVVADEPPRWTEALIVVRGFYGTLKPTDIELVLVFNSYDNKAFLASSSRTLASFIDLDPS